jgi:DNA processing protein
MPLDSETLAWLRLVATPGVDRTSVRRWLAALADPVAVLCAAEARLAALSSARAAHALLTGWHTPAVDGAGRERALQDWLESAPAGVARRLITLGDPLYPAAWLQQADPPVLVFASGQLDRAPSPAWQRPSLAIVGSRHATPQGLDNARAFARHLGEAGWCIVSGLALGIDGAAHEAALSTAGGTVAITGTGIDVIYPSRHGKLYEAVQREGVLLSEYAPGTPALPHQFPERNRLIAGLARGTLVVEAAVQSGSLITARLAVEMGREVFAIPGSIHSPQSRGCHALIKQGAKLVESAADILEELGAAPVPATSTGKPSQRSEDPILEALGWQPMSIDELGARTGRSASDLGARLLELEFAGSVRRLPGQRYERVTQA